METYREFVLEGALVASIDLPRSREYQFFLFTDLLLYATKKKLAIVNPLGAKKPLLNYRGFFILNRLSYIDVRDQPGRESAHPRQILWILNHWVG